MSRLAAPGAGRRRPHRNLIKVDGTVEATFRDLEIKELAGVDVGVAAVAWILHHEYAGALRQKALVKGIRLRTGNMQDSGIGAGLR